MNSYIDLGGQWKCVGVGPDLSKKMEFVGKVPGHVHVDLLSAGLIKDPFWRNQADECQWVEDWDWAYSREFTLPDGFDTSWAVLEFGGLDTYAEILLNSEVIGKTNNMHVTYRFEVGDKLKKENKIEVRFQSFKKATAGKPVDKYSAAFFTTERVHVRRMQCTFHWDWVNRFVSSGIWRQVKLNSYNKARIEDLYIYTSSLTDDNAALEIEVNVEKRCHEVVNAVVEILDPDNNPVWSKNVSISDSSTKLHADIQNPHLWWPVGSGDQPLYKLKVSLENDIDAKSVDFGIRTIRVEQLPDQPGSPEMERTMEIRALGMGVERNGDASGSSFRVIVNGKPIFCKGGNWVPADPWPSRITTDHYDRLIKLAHDANINILRCWGGGVYEPQEFWDACNKYGVMISQDFQMACAHYPEDDPEFMDNLRVEIPAAVRMLRNNPSLAWWSGDNEDGMHCDFDDPNYPGRKIAEEISGPAVRDLDPSRNFLPTSPYGGRSNSCLTVGDCHHSGMWDEQMTFVTKSDMTDYRDRIAVVGRS